MSTRRMNAALKTEMALAFATRLNEETDDEQDIFFVLSAAAGLVLHRQVELKLIPLTQ